MEKFYILTKVTQIQSSWAMNNPQEGELSFFCPSMNCYVNSKFKLSWEFPCHCLADPIASLAAAVGRSRRSSLPSSADLWPPHAFPFMSLSLFICPIGSHSGWLPSPAHFHLSVDLPMITGHSCIRTCIMFSEAIHWTTAIALEDFISCSHISYFTK